MSGLHKTIQHTLIPYQKQIDEQTDKQTNTNTGIPGGSWVLLAKDNGFIVIAKPFSASTGSMQPLVWTETEQRALKALKKALVSTLALALTAIPLVCE